VQCDALWCIRCRILQLQITATHYDIPQLQITATHYDILQLQITATHRNNEMQLLRL